MIEITPKVKDLGFYEWEKKFKTQADWIRFVERLREFRPAWVGEFPPAEDWFFFYSLGKQDGYAQARKAVGQQVTLD